MTAFAFRRGTPLRLRDTLGIVAVLASLAAGLAWSDWAWRLDRVVYDLGLSLWTRPAPPQITIVAIDDASVQAIGRWPWPRAVHATLLQRLAQAQPKAIALDLVLSEPDADPRQDRWLAEALQRAAPVVLPVAWQAAAGGPLARLQPAEPLRAAARLGAAEAPVDADGVLRHAFLKAGPAGAPLPHLALALMQAAGEPLPVALRPEHDAAAAAAGASNWQRDGRLLIRYAGPPGTVQRVSYAEVLSGQVPAERLRGHYLLVGMTAQGLGDTLATPVNARHQAMPGVEVLANTLYTLRSGDVMRPLGAGTVAALSALLLALLVPGFGRLGPRAALPLALLSVPLAVAASLLALRSGWWCSPVPCALAALLAYPLWSWRRLERAMAGLDREIGRLAELPMTAPVIAPTTGDAIDTRLQTLRRAAASLRAARRFLADTLAALPTAVLVADAQGRVLLANPQAAGLFEVASAEELHGLDLLRLLAELHTDGRFDWPAAIDALQPGRPGVVVEARLPGQAELIIQLAALDAPDERCLVVTLADVAPVKQAQREREEALAFVSHDLRSPAISIVLLADMQLQGALHKPQTELLQEVRRLAQRTLNLSEAFVRAAQVQVQALQREPVELAALLDEAVLDLRAQADAAGVQLCLRAPAAGVVRVDRLLVARALGNLVSNALRHSPRGAVVDVRALPEAGALQLQVRDRGPGLTPAQAERLAEGDRGLAVRDARGVGLGLVFVQRVALRHGGRLQVQVMDPGSLFTLHLALQDAVR